MSDEPTTTDERICDICERDLAELERAGVTNREDICTDCWAEHDADIAADEERDLLLRQIEYAPRDGSPYPYDLVGWVTPNGNAVCQRCAARIYARGCSLPKGVTSVWSGTILPVPCCTCPQEAK